MYLTMPNPFFKNTGPHNINFLLKTINLNNDNLPEDMIVDIKDLNSSQKNEITFLHSKKYIDSQGNLFPISSNFSERVILIHMNNDLDINNKNLKFSKDLMNMINFINGDDFLSKIISEIEIKSNKNIVIHPQLSKQKFIFGYPDNLEEKFKKIMLFYNNIAPTKGWNTYKTVNVKFRNQIICDKNA